MSVLVVGVEDGSDAAQEGRHVVGELVAAIPEDNEVEAGEQQQEH